LNLVNGGFISSNTYTDGKAGEVTVSGRDLEVRNGGQIVSSTFAQGNAGTVTVNAADQLLVNGDGARNADGTSSFTGIASSAGFGSIGAGGAVNIQAQNIVLQDGGAVTTESAGTGRGGPISISAADTLRLDNAEIQAQTTLADGGNIALAVGRLFDLRQSAVTTSVAGGGGTGGNITIDHPRFMILDGSRIEANAFGGPGGNITIQADQLIRTPDSVIQASSAQSVAGTITTPAPNVDVANSLVVLPETFLDASSQLREACARQGGRPTSSLVTGGRGGLPPDPDAPLSASPSNGLADGRRADQPLHGAATLPLPPATKGTLIAGNPVLGAPRISCRG
jgi:large exoprotein involved in heme utilization and adhesion